MYLVVPREDIRKGAYSLFHDGLQTPWFLKGPAYGPNHHEWVLKIKDAFDPDYLSAPPVPLDNDVFVDRSDWMKKALTPEEYETMTSIFSRARKQLHEIS